MSLKDGMTEQTRYHDIFSKVDGFTYWVLGLAQYELLAMRGKGADIAKPLILR